MESIIPHQKPVSYQMHLMETPVASLNDKDGVMDLLQAFERRIAQQEKQSKEYFHQISGRLEKSRNG
ncbi:unnamed protein product [Rhizoctonia solani]|uniref:Uncharacterized protein n=1 Tax=Rhizoctonia solani TaxID=456999 RepID=A0A8H3C200_9AGAM|nr:unnamed protein product [Rhizoctonia solani]